MTLNSNIAPFPDLKAIEKAAANWIALQERRDLTPDETHAFETWKAQSPQHREMLEALGGLWSDFDRLDELHDYAPMESGGVQTRVGKSHIGSLSLPRGPFMAAMAASLMLIFAGAVYVTGYSPWSPIRHGTFQTVLGEQETIVLADGSAVMLNTDSAVEVDFRSNARIVRLIRGEAHFDVTHDASRPFSVYAGENIVRAVGTAFSVRVERGNEVEVIVDEGRVALLNEEERSAPALEAQSAPIGEVDIGGAAMLRGATIESMTKLSNEELLRKLAWRQGRISFAGEPLDEALVELARYTDMEIEVTDPTIEEIKIGGAFRIGEVEEFLTALETSFGVTVERVSDRHVRLSRAS